MSRQFRSSSLDKVRLHLLGGAASALWAKTWADAMDEAGRSRELSGNEITEIMPPIPRVMRNLAISLVDRVEAMNNIALEELLDINRWTDDAKDFGHYLAMESLGHGVSWSDDHQDHGLKLPHVEVFMSDPDDVETIDWSGFSRANPCSKNPFHERQGAEFLGKADWMVASDLTRTREYRQHIVTIVFNDSMAIAELEANGYAFRQQKGGRYAEFIKRIPVGVKKNPACQQPVGYVSDTGRLRCMSCESKYRLNEKTEANGLRRSSRHRPVERDSSPHAFESCDYCGKPLQAKKNPAWTNRTHGKKLRVPYASPSGTGEKQLGGVVGDYDNVAEEFVDQMGWWMHENHLETDTHWYTRNQWRKRKEQYGNDAVITLTAEGAFYQLMNHPRPPSFEDDVDELRGDYLCDDDLINEFNALVEEYDLYYEQGYAWTFHFYPHGRGTIEGTIWDDYLKAIGP